MLSIFLILSRVLIVLIIDLFLLIISLFIKIQLIIIHKLIASIFIASSSIPIFSLDSLIWLNSVLINIRKLNIWICATFKDLYRDVLIGLNLYNIVYYVKWFRVRGLLLLCSFVFVIKWALFNFSLWFWSWFFRFRFWLLLKDTFLGLFVIQVMILFVLDKNTTLIQSINIILFLLIHIIVIRIRIRS